MANKDKYMCLFTLQFHFLAKITYMQFTHDFISELHI